MPAQPAFQTAIDFVQALAPAAFGLGWSVAKLRSCVRAWLRVRRLR